MPDKQCLTCGINSGTSRLCPACRQRADKIWELERTLVVCPNVSCGWSPLEEEGLFTMFPRQAAIADRDDNIILIFDRQGCHRCAQKGHPHFAEVHRIRPTSSPPSSS